MSANPKYVCNICPSMHPLDLHTNAGVLTIDQVADLECSLTVWYDERAITNVLSFARIHQDYGVTFDDKKNVFKIQKPIMGIKTMNFPHMGNQYVYVMPQSKTIGKRVKFGSSCHVMRFELQESPWDSIPQMDYKVPMKGVSLPQTVQENESY